MEISSEIYAETDFGSLTTENGTIISRFSFTYPPAGDDDELEKSTSAITKAIKNQKNKIKCDADGDLILKRKARSVIQIEHHKSTELTLVGLQVWRGALILADFLIDNRKKFADKNILEVGSGVGLTSIAAGIFSKCTILCTDIDIGGILNLIRDNVERNRNLLGNNCQIEVTELNFKMINWTDGFKEKIRSTDVILAADVIYDNDLTDAFVHTLELLLDPSDFNVKRNKEIYIALEKRYVFTLADLDTAAPCYEYFLHCVENVRSEKKWKFESIPIDFEQYFDYERVKELVLLKLSL